MINKDAPFWFLRCTEQKYANMLKDSGTIKFNTPSNWINMELIEGRGRGDLYEGVFGALPLKEIQGICELRGIRNNVDGMTIEGMTYLRSNDVIKLPCFCLFGLSINSFNIDFYKEKRKWVKICNISQKYFKDFYNYTSREEIELLNQDERPVLVIIKNTRVFIEKIYTYFESLGLDKREIICDFVRYQDKKSPFYIKSKAPSELFSKDINFREQSEFRIVINTNKKNVIEKLEQQNYIINLGSLETIVQIEKFFLNNMLVELDGHEVNFSLPEPVKMSLDEISEAKVFGVLHEIYFGDGSKINSDQSTEDLIKDLDKHLYDKFGVISYKFEDEYAIVKKIDFNDNSIDCTFHTEKIRISKLYSIGI